MAGFKATDVFLCLGRRGSGKSYLARRIQSAYPRKVIFDPLSEYSDSDGIICHSFEEFSKAVLETENEKKFTLVYQFDIECEDHSSEFNQALRVLWHRGNVLIVCEEIQMLASAHYLPMWLRNQLLTGRHRNNGLLFTTQRPGECHKTIISQSNHVFCGSLHERNDVDYVRAVLGDDAFKLADFPERHFLYFRPGGIIMRIDNNFNPLG